MVKLIRKTMSIYLIQFIIYLSVPGMYILMINLALKVNRNIVIPWIATNPTIPGFLAKFVLGPALLIIGAGLASFWSLHVVSLLIWYVNQALVVAVTVFVNGLPYKGSLTSYAFKEVNESLLVFSAKSIISRKTFKWVQKIKTSLLDKKILSGLFNHKWLFIRKIMGLLRNTVSLTLDMADEVLISYTWMTMRMYKDYGPDGRKPSLAKSVKNQARFFLEGFVHYISCFPKLVVNSIIPEIVIQLIVVMASVLIAVLTFVVFGLSWLNVFWILFFFHSICSWISNVVLQYSYTLLILDKFYKTLHTMEPITSDSLVSSILRIPILANIAKKTGMSEFKDMKFEESCPSDLLELSAVESMLGDEAANLAKTWSIEPDGLPDEDTEDVTGESVDGDTQADEQPAETVEEVVSTISEPDEPALVLPELMVAPEEDEDEFSTVGMPTLPTTERHVKPFKG